MGPSCFLEDVNENIYRLDRLMTHLKIAGVFDRLASSSGNVLNA